jgi:transposase
MRAKIILALARDPCVVAAAGSLGIDPKTVRYWRDRFRREGRKGLGTRPRSGRPVSIDMVSRCQIIGMACGKPEDFQVEFRSVWTLDSLLDTYRKQNLELAPLSRTTVVRLLNQEGIRPHRMRVWLHSPDPQFREKVTEICGLYLSPPPGAVVLCIDEKTGMQALSRKHPTRQPAPGRDGRVDFEYKRHGTVTLLAAFNPHTGEVFGRTPPNRKAPALIAFMEAVAERWPEVEIHVVWDNLNTHLDGPDKRWTQFNWRHGDRFHFHYTPIHASWVNQVENVFSVLDRRVWRYWVHHSKKELAARVMGFIAHWNVNERHPFNWKFQGYPTGIASTGARSSRARKAKRGRKNGSRRRPRVRVPARQAAGP